MKDIICDTNIWYDIGKGSIPINKIYGLPLVCTHLSLNELLNSPNLYIDQDAVRNAVRAIKEFGSMINLQNPYIHGITRFLPDYSYCTDNSSEIWKQLESLLNNEILFSDEQVEILNNIFSERSKEFKEEIAELNKNALPNKNYIKDNHIRNDIRHTDYSFHFRKTLVDYLISYHKQNSNTAIQISLDSDNWDDLELIIEVWSHFTKCLDINYDQKLHTNDWGDILNMIYVGRNDLYWTSEKKWNNLIKANPRTQKYLFQLN